MLSLFESSACLTRELSKHFGETIPLPCGNCSFCISGVPTKFPGESLPEINRADVKEYIRELKEVSGSPVSDDLASRFLCGIISPRLIQLKAKQLNGFGRLEKCPYKAVKGWIR